MKYRSKPVDIEAVYWGGALENVVDPPAWFAEALCKPNYAHGSIQFLNGALFLFTTQGLITASEGDYVCRSASGLLFVCSAAEFAATYEPLGDTDGGAALKSEDD